MSTFLQGINDAILKGSKSLQGPKMAALAA